MPKAKTIKKLPIRDEVKQTHVSKKANTKPPENAEQLEYWQFRISKSKGRVIGAIIDNVFYIVWLDAHHNLTNSEGYGREQFYRKPKSAYEELEAENERLKEEIEILEQACNECEGNIHKN